MENKDIILRELYNCVCNVTLVDVENIKYNYKDSTIKTKQIRDAITCRIDKILNILNELIGMIEEEEENALN